MVVPLTVGIEIDLSSIKNEEMEDKRQILALQGGTETSVSESVNAVSNDSQCTGVPGTRQGERYCADALSADAEQMRTQLKRDRMETSQKSMQQTLQDIVDSVVNYGEELLMADSRKRSNKYKLQIVAKAIIDAADGNLAVIHYVVQQEKQQVYVYDRTCWRLIQWQTYLDFIVDCAKRVGFQPIDYDDEKLMLALSSKVAFMVSRARTQISSASEIYINMLNGTLVIDSEGACALRAHDREDFFTYVLPYCYDEKACCPMWKKFLNEVLPEKEAQKLLSEYIGYSFTRGIKAEKMLVLHGTGSNGKSVVLDVVVRLIGESAVSFVGLSDITNDAEKRAMIEHKLVNISHESNTVVDPAVLKKVVSGEPVDVRELYIGPHTMTNYAKLITSYNLLPRAEATHGFYRRFIIMPFSVTIKEKDADKNLANKISATELPGILNWVISGLKQFMQSGQFTDSPVCDKALSNYKLSSDSVLLFVSKGLSTSNDSYSANGRNLYNDYKLMCVEDEIKPVGKQKFFNRLDCMVLEDGSIIHKSIYNGVVYFNLKKKEDEAPF